MSSNNRFITICQALLFLSPVLHAESDPLKRIAAELADGISRHKNLKVAVLATPHHDNHRSDGPYLVSERLTTYLVTDKRISVLDRNHIVQLLNELHLSETGALDPQTTRKIGQALGADVIVTGTLIDLDGNLSELNARGLFSENGRIIVASRAVINREWASRPVLEW